VGKGIGRATSAESKPRRVGARQPMATVNGPTIAVSRNAGGKGAESLNDRIRMQPERRRNREAERLAVFSSTDCVSRVEAGNCF
jgi:hypothetical protein